MFLDIPKIPITISIPNICQRGNPDDGQKTMLVSGQCEDNNNKLSM